MTIITIIIMTRKMVMILVRTMVTTMTIINNKCYVFMYVLFLILLLATFYLGFCMSGGQYIRQVGYIDEPLFLAFCVSGSQYISWLH